MLCMAMADPMGVVVESLSWNDSLGDGRRAVSEIGGGGGCRGGCAGENNPPKYFLLLHREPKIVHSYRHEKGIEEEVGEGEGKLFHNSNERRAATSLRLPRPTLSRKRCRPRPLLKIRTASNKAGGERSQLPSTTNVAPSSTRPD